MINELARCVTVLEEIAVKGDDKARLLAVENCLRKIIQDGSKADQADKQTSSSDKGGAATKRGAASDDPGTPVERKPKKD